MTDTPNKFLIVRFSNGEEWAIPAKAIAHDRAVYYAGLDVERGDKDNFGVAYQEELVYGLGDDNEILVWASTNTDWEDVKDVALIVNTAPEINRKKEWTNADRSIQMR